MIPVFDKDTTLGVTVLLRSRSPMERVPVFVSLLLVSVSDPVVLSPLPMVIVGSSLVPVIVIVIN